ncbi:MAG: acetylglutamate kinase [Methylocystaceae bacterium]
MVVTALEKASILVEALPYIKEFYGKTVVIKYGGSAMIDPKLKKAVIEDIVLMRYVGMNPIVVHGGGPDITRMLSRLNLESRFIDGYRVTSSEAMEVVEMVLVGKVNKEIVNCITSMGGRAVGLSGSDDHLIVAAPMPGRDDLGYVGEVAAINSDIVNTVVARGYIPVISPVGLDINGQSYNINADLVAAAVATALNADKMVLLTDVPGLLADPHDVDSLIPTLRVSEVPGLIEQGVIAGGMLPKVECCLRAVKGGVKRTHIIDGRVLHSILLEIFTREGVGTMVVDQ